MPAQILVVDDLLLTRMILRAKLSAACYDTKMAASGAEALRLVSEQVPDLVLLDCNLPDATGLEICAMLRNTPNAQCVPIILFSADQSQATRLQALATGADDFLSKPLDDAYLMSRIRALLRNSAAENDYHTDATPALRRGMAEAAAGFQPAGRVTLVQGRAGGRSMHGTDAALYDAACSLPDALAKAGTQRKPDVLLLAPEILEENGLHVIAELRARPATCRIPIAALLGADAQISRAMVLDLGAEEAMRLPLDTQELRLRLQAIIKRKHKLDALRHALGAELNLASRDALTGLFNRRHAMSRLSDIVAARPEAFGKTYAILLIDLDNFKRVNDCFGHGAGDEVLIEASARMRDAIGPQDLLARYGGEEFLLVLPGADMPTAREMAEKIRRQIEGHDYALTSGEYRLQMTASIGVTVQVYDACDAPTTRLDLIRKVIDHADQALRVAKSAGRNQVSIGRCAVA